MKTLPFVLALSLGAAVSASAQEGPISLADDVDVMLSEPTSADPVAHAETVPQEERDRDSELGRPGRYSERELFHLGIGPQAGYFRTKGADSGTWFGGIQARMWLLEILGVEA